MKSLRKLRSVLLNIHFLLFANGFLIGAILFCCAQNDYEDRLFLSAAKNICNPASNPSQYAQIINALHGTYTLLSKRQAIFDNTGGFIDDFIHPATDDMMTAGGACGSYSITLCRLLNAAGFKTRIAQMKVNGEYGGHIIVEARTTQGWVALDALYDLCFTRPDGRLASIDDVSANWEWYRKQVPAGYNKNYKYEGARYTNWNKIPVVLPAMKKVLSVCWSEDKLSHFCLRNYFLRKYRVCANILLLITIPLTCMIIYRVIFLKWKLSLKLPGWYIDQYNSVLNQPANA